MREWGSLFELSRFAVVRGFVLKFHKLRLNLKTQRFWAKIRILQNRNYNFVKILLKQRREKRDLRESIDLLETFDPDLNVLRKTSVFLLRVSIDYQKQQKDDREKNIGKRQILEKILREIDNKSLVKDFLFFAQGTWFPFPSLSLRFSSFSRRTMSWK